MTTMGRTGIACTNCPLSYNMFSSGTQGSNAITGTPTYVGGGTKPAAWAGWELAAGSVGKSNAHDGQDRGTTYYGTGTITPPPTDTTAPTTPANLTATAVSVADQPRVDGKH